MTVNVARDLTMREQLGASDPALRDLLGEELASVPDMVVTSLSFEDDAVRWTAATSLPAGDPAPSNTRRTLAASVPNDAIFFADASNVGASASSGWRACATSSAAAGEWRDGPAAADRGGARRAAGRALQLDRRWRVAAGWDGEQPTWAWSEVTDADAATQRLRQLQNLLSLVTMDPSAEVEVTTETVAGVEVTSIRFDHDAHGRRRR